jgi:ABC-type lipoprotein release transport system permease subunit
VAVKQLGVLLPPVGSGLFPYWIDFSLSATTVLYVVGLAVVGALIAGVLPAIRATGPRMQTGFKPWARAVRRSSSDERGPC